MLCGRFLLALGTAALVVACASIPDVTFQDGTSDGASPDQDSGEFGSDGAVSSTDGGGGGTTDGSNKKDGSTFSMDSGGGNPCGGGVGDICCGTMACHGCSASDCANCTGLACTAGNICCLKGVNLICHLPGTMGC